MRLYKTNYPDDDATGGASRNELAVWCGTKSDAASDRKRLKVDGMRDIETEEVDVPTDKAGLLTFLSTWCIVR